jgi:hypothetical protein
MNEQSGDTGKGAIINEQSGDTGNTGHKTHDDDKQNKTHQTES